MRSNRFPGPLLLAAACFAAAAGSASATTYAAPAPPQGGDAEQAYVTTRTNVRSGPGTTYPIVNRLDRGDFVNVVRCRGTWCYVDVYGGNGWVSGRLIGRGQNPYNDHGPAGPGIPPQEPGTRRY